MRDYTTTKVIEAGFVDDIKVRLATLRQFQEIEKLLANIPGDSLAEKVKELDQRVRDREAELLRVRTAQTNAAVEVEKLRIDLGIINDPEISLAEKVKTLVEADRWIPVSERLPDTPEYSETYNVIVEGWSKPASFEWRFNKYAATPRGQGPKWLWNGQVSGRTVTHWRPLPAPPLSPASEGAK